MRKRALVAAPTPSVDGGHPGGDYINAATFALHQYNDSQPVTPPATSHFQRVINLFAEGLQR